VSFNALVDGGWLGRLSAVETHVLIIHFRFMGADGIAWPSCRKIAELLGHSSAHHVQRARRSLIGRGLLVDAWGWTNGIDARRLKLVIPPPAQSATPGVIGRRPNRTVTPGALRPPPPAQSDPDPRRNRPETLPYDSPIEQTNEQPGGFAAAADDKSDQEKAAVKAELKRVRIGEPMRSRLASIPGLCAVHVSIIEAELREAVKGNAAHMPGCIVNRLKSGEQLPDTIGPKRMCTLINAGRIRRIGEHAIDVNGERATWNDHGVYLPGGCTIPAAELIAGLIEMRWEPSPQ